MSDDKKKAEIFFAQVEGQPARLIRTTDMRLARKHVLAGIHPPAVEVRRPTTEEAMDMALDGVQVEHAMGEPASTPQAEPSGTMGGAQIEGNDDGRPDLNDPPRINPEDDADDGLFGGAQ